MEHFITRLDKISRRITRQYVCVFLDFDGTLAPIRKDPHSVKLGLSVRKTLAGLASLKDVCVTVVSGRSLRDIRRIVGIKGIVYVGNHGFDAEKTGKGSLLPGRIRSRIAASEKEIRSLSGKLKRGLKRYKGVIVEDKGATLAVHFRKASKNKIQEVSAAFRSITGPYESAGRIVVTSGKKVWEVRPPFKWDKGRAVSELLKRQRSRAGKSVISFYIGDDRTDEDAFRVLKHGTFTVKVGKTGANDTHAAYYVKGPGEVKDLLRKMYTLKKGAKKDVR